MKLSLIVFIPFLLFCFKGKKRDVINGFDSEIWKKDSNACLGIRSSNHYLDTLYCNKDKIIGITESELIDLLGKPNEFGKDTFHHNSNFGYFIEKGEQCWGVLERNRSPDVKTLVFVTKNNRVFQIDVSSGSYPKCK